MKAKCKADISTAKIGKPDPFLLKCNMGGEKPLFVAVFCSAAGSRPHSSNCSLASYCRHSSLSL